MNKERVAFNVRCIRMARNLTQEELARLAGVGKSTVCRVERALPVHRNSLQKIASAFHESIDFLNSVLPYEQGRSRPVLHVHRQADNNWYSGRDRRKRVPQDHQRRIQDEAERLRLGRLGFIDSFQSYMIVMPNSPAMSQIEVYGPAGIAPNFTYDAAIVCCIRGRLLLRTDDKEIVLEVGDSAGFATDLYATIEPADPIGPTDLAPLAWFITAGRKGHVPIEFNHQKRSRIRHNVPL